MCGDRCDVFAEKADSTVGTIEIPCDCVEQSRFSGSVRSQNRAAFTGGDLHIDVGQRHERTEMTRNAIQLQRVRAGAGQTGTFT